MFVVVFSFAARLSTRVLFVRDRMPCLLLAFSLSAESVVFSKSKKNFFRLFTKHDAATQRANQREEIESDRVIVRFLQPV